MTPLPGMEVLSLAESMIYTHFCKKSCCVQDLKDIKADGPVRVQVAKIIELTPKQYQYFSTHLLRDMPFLAANKGLTDCDPQGVNHCLLVTVRSREDAILVDCQGYSYARYAAYVPDKSELDLQNVAVEHGDLKLRQPRIRRER